MPNRKLGALLNSLIDFVLWLEHRNLEGWVYAQYSEIIVNSKHQIVFDNNLIERPSSNFQKLNRAVLKPVLFEGIDEKKGVLQKLSDKIFNENLLITTQLVAPENNLGHNDLRSDIFKIGLLLVKLFSNCDVDDIEQLRDLLILENSNENWANLQLQYAAKKCLKINPSQRIDLQKLIEILKPISSELINPANSDTISSFQSILNGFKASILDFSSRNPLFNFKETAQYLSINESFASLIKNGFFREYDIDLGGAELQKLHNIRRKQNLSIREKGEDGLLLVTHFLYWKNEGESIISPLFWVSVSLNYTKEFKIKYELEFELDVVQVNEILRIYFKEQFNFYLPKYVSISVLNDFISNLNTELLEKGAEIECIEEQIVLGNFAYHNISIASDYDQLISSDANNLNLLLLGFQKQESNSETINVAHWENHFVLPADPSQEAALKQIQNQSIVIEGPPGTGKSQTITNLLAQSIAKGEKVLFVSEKRAALEVVYNRLQKAELSEISLLVHNTRKEKKEVISSIKQSYQRLSTPLERDANLGKNLASWNLEQTFNNLDGYFRTVRTINHGFSLNNLFLKETEISKPFDDEWIPDLGDWLKQKDNIKQIANLLSKRKSQAVWKHNLISNFDIRSYAISNEPSKLLKTAFNSCHDAIKKVQSIDSKNHFELNIGEILQIRSLSKSLKWLIERNFVKLVLDDNPLKSSYEKLRDQYLAKQALIEKRKLKGKQLDLSAISLRELESALIKCEAEPESKELAEFVSSFVKSDEWFVDDVKTILKNAIFEYKNDIQLTELEAKFQSQFKTNNPDEFIEQVALLQDLTQRMQYYLVDFFDLLNHKRFPDSIFLSFLQLDDALNQLESNAFLLHKNFRELSIKDFKSYLSELKSVSIDSEVHIIFRLFNDLKPNLKYCLEHSTLEILELEQASVKRELKRAFVANPDLEKYNSKKLNDLLNQLNLEYDEWLNWNSWKLLDGKILEFQRLQTLAATPAAKLQETEKQEKWKFKKGMRILRNEMDKERQHKSLRELVHSDAITALDILKPIYLMSPVAVAEVFPCEKELFDLVVFDEASQLRLEEVLPICHRAKRIAVVGDSEQLPPTDFFKSSAIQAQTIDNLKFSSFLLAAKAAFTSVTLTWHYRSSSQELIQFSNKAFYQGRLKVFPTFNSVQPSIRAIYCKNGLYENRKNETEATAIIESFAELLKKDRISSYAIIALSETQQQTLEDAIQQKRKSDLEFDRLMDWEENRFEQGTFTGLLVKNLENIQGEERDVVLISLGYGYNSEGKFRQNFGPIMREGGDRRLNVLFSRAKSQMLVFHSFNLEDLNNDQNVGLWTLKQFLKYAKAVEFDDKFGQGLVLNLMSKGVTNTVLKQNDKDKSIISKVKDIVTKDKELQELDVANSASPIHFQRMQGHQPRPIVYELENSEPDTWNEFFVSKRILENRGFKVEKLSTQELVKTRI